MSSLDERTVAAAHVLLDMVSVQDFNKPNDESINLATRTAFERLNEIEAVTATRDDETEVTHVDATALLSGAGALVAMLMTLIQEEGYERDGLIVAMRNVIDDLATDGA